ncbi:metal-dependent hydrolase [Paenibacillus sp. 1A_MP2]|uniref:metal-dependent hydrolase n=1 Tax=Paenibacillus sp. 1A_MP2 TaxID=3457495 RepID=UPI003FCEB855
MNHKVHHLTGVVIGQSTLLYFQEPVLSINTILVMVVTNIAAIFPDIDKPESFISAHQPMRFVSEMFQRLGIPHRGPTHSLPILLVLFLVLKLMNLSDLYVWSITLAYFSHIFLDMFTTKGVMLLYPLKINFRFLPSFLAVSSEDSSIVQNIFNIMLSICFYSLMADICLRLLGEIPWLGGYVDIIHSKLLDLSSFIWLPIVDFITSVINALS